MEANQILFYLLAAYLLTHVPFIGRFISMLNTLIHENGHALAALILSGKVYSIKLFIDTSGEILTRQRGWLSGVIIAYSGYTFSSIVSYVCFFLLNKGEVESILYLFLAIAVLNLLLWTRNLYGGIWLITFIFICGWAIQEASGDLQEKITYFLASVLLIESVSSALQIFLLCIIRRKEAGDATSLAVYTKIPAFFWGLLFLLQALYVAYLVISEHVY